MPSVHTADNVYRHNSWFIFRCLPEGKDFENWEMFLDHGYHIELFRKIIKWFQTSQNRSRCKREQIKFLLLNAKNLNKTRKFLRESKGRTKKQTYHQIDFDSDDLAQCQTEIKKIIKDKYEKEGEKLWEEFTESHPEIETIRELKQIIEPVMLLQQNLEKTKRNYKKEIAEGTTSDDSNSHNSQINAEEEIQINQILEQDSDNSIGLTHFLNYENIQTFFLTNELSSEFSGQKGQLEFLQDERSSANWN